MVQCPIPRMRLRARNAPREHHLEDIAYNYSQLSANGLVSGQLYLRTLFSINLFTSPHPSQTLYLHILVSTNCFEIFLSIYALS